MRVRLRMLFKYTEIVYRQTYDVSANARVYGWIPGLRQLFGPPLLLRLIIPLVSLGTPWPNKWNHKTLHFESFLNEIFNAASIKITVFKVKTHFTENPSLISTLLIILTGICIFSKIFKQMQVLQKQKEICKCSACVLHSVKCWYILYCNTELFLNKQKDHQVYVFSKI